jgi:hypothetical protein
MDVAHPDCLTTFKPKNSAQEAFHHHHHFLYTGRIIVKSRLPKSGSAAAEKTVIERQAPSFGSRK